jgi:hypothetical protein
MAQDLILCRSKLFADTIPEDLLEQDYAYPHLFVYREAQKDNPHAIPERRNLAEETNN